MSGPELLLFSSVFLACLVEGAEAVTVVLAAGITRGWRSAMIGIAAGCGVLVVVIALLGPALTTIPLGVLRALVGSLLLIFGLQWLRKAILRASGLKALHDEDSIFAEELASARKAGHVDAGIDHYGFLLSFKAIVPEGLEVAFIAVTFGSNQDNIPLAAVAAVIVVVAVAVAVRAPLSRVPENTIKFAVGALLTSFGLFWAAEAVVAFGATAGLCASGINAWWALPLAALGGLALSVRRAARSQTRQSGAVHVERCTVREWLPQTRSNPLAGPSAATC
jgi:uncharacterized membrane protein